MSDAPNDATRAMLKKAMDLEAAATRPLRGLTWVLAGCGVFVVLLILATVLIPFWQLVGDAKDMVRQFLSRVEAAEYDEAFSYCDADMIDAQRFRLIAQRIHDRMGDAGYVVKRFEREDGRDEEGHEHGAAIIVAQIGPESQGIELRVQVYTLDARWYVAGLTLRDSLSQDEPGILQTQPHR